LGESLPHCRLAKVARRSAKSKHVVVRTVFDPHDRLSACTSAKRLAPHPLFNDPHLDSPRVNSPVVSEKSSA
jgi:hypothetical protein